MIPCSLKATKSAGGAMAATVAGPHAALLAAKDRGRLLPSRNRLGLQHGPTAHETWSSWLPTACVTAFVVPECWAYLQEIR